MELWEILPEFANMTTLFQKFVDAMYKLYDKLVGETLRAGISLLTDLGKYYREFITITTFLITKNCITTPEQSLAHGFSPELWRRVSYQLQLKFPDHRFQSLLLVTDWPADVAL